LNSKKPLIILGESFFKNQSANFIFHLIKKFLKENDKISDEWNSLNKISTDASTVGCLDLNIINEKDDIFEKLNNHKFDIVYLLGQDNLNFSKENEFVIYQGSHGDKGAEIADIILPGATYTEQNGFFTNLEGKLQKAYKASYPPGESKEDWLIINELAEFMNNRRLFNDKDELDSSMLNYLNLQKENSNTSSLVPQNKENFKNENLKIDYKDYYFSNAIARSSKTMLDCHNSKLKIKRTGTDG
jgi:NADH-quinone oxidoreductase subunit G